MHGIRNITAGTPLEMTVGKHGEAEHKRVKKGKKRKENRTTKKGSGRGNNGDGREPCTVANRFATVRAVCHGIIKA
jgi:hypothetical protein